VLASIHYISRSHAPAWERILDVPTSRGRKPTKTGRWRVRNRFPRRRVGTRKRRDAGASGIGSHAGAWEPEKDGTLARPESVPTPARGNQKKTGRWRVRNWFPRRRVGTRKHPTHLRGNPFSLLPRRIS
jgi:hypothetical protein